MNGSAGVQRRVESSMMTGTRIAAFWLGAFAPSALVVGAALAGDWAALLGFQGTLVGIALAWSYCWFRSGAANWRWIFLSGWAVGALVTVLAWVGRGAEAERGLLIAIIESGVYALSFRLVAFAFSGAPSTPVALPSSTRVI
ncbi:MAG TPA: hypothetical protein VLV45_02265 [Gemmatimonadales bacterium]|nr:hypothetical protein [Gemmatimonadales bacterium]